MNRSAKLLMMLFAMAPWFGCQRAQQYPTAAKIEKKDESKFDAEEHDLPCLGWLEPGETQDVPIVFVPEASLEWPHLPATWSSYPPIPAHIGLPPLQAVAALAMTEPQRAIKIKMPRGLPDPKSYIPGANRPTLAKWRLGKALFFTPMLTVESRKYSCATCHDPRYGFAEDPNNPVKAKYDVPSLINIVFNRRQFWDGRVETLEETLARSLDDERKLSPEKRLARGLAEHNWGGFVRDLDEKKDKDLTRRFEAAFGIRHATQDAVAQALATYMRTLLSGDSLFDQAERIARVQGAKSIDAAHFAIVLKDEVTAASLRDNLHSETPKRAEMPGLLARGYELFHDEGRCSQCHSGPLFTDADFHNIGRSGDVGVDQKPTGRAAHVPVGLREARFYGAYRTPSLRTLASTHPYFHDRSRRTLRDVIQYYADEVPASRSLASALKEGDQPRRLNWTPTDHEAMVVFLRSLQGRPVDPSVVAP